MDLRRVRVERGLGVGDERQRLVLDLDQAQGVLGDLLGVGGDGRHLVADVADGLVEEHGCPRTRRSRALRAAEDGPDAGQRLGLRGVDALDPRVRVRAAQDPGVELAGQADVVGVLGAAGDFQVALDARDAACRRRAGRRPSPRPGAVPARLLSSTSVCGLAVCSVSLRSTWVMVIAASRCRSRRAARRRAARP